MVLSAYIKNTSKTKWTQWVVFMYLLNKYMYNVIVLIRNWKGEMRKSGHRMCHRDQKEVKNDVNIVKIHEILKWDFILREKNTTSIRSLFSSK